MAMPTLTAVVFIVMAAVVVVAVIVVMMVAAGIRVISEVSFGKGLRRSVCRSLNAGIELDAGIRESRLRSHADATADQSIHLLRLQKSYKRTVAASVCIHDPLSDDSVFFHII